MRLSGELPLWFPAALVQWLWTRYATTSSGGSCRRSRETAEFHVVDRGIFGQHVHADLIAETPFHVIAHAMRRQSKETFAMQRN
jgi:hypothetical protein